MVDRNRFAIVAKTIKADFSVFVRQQSVALPAKIVLAERVAALQIATLMNMLPFTSAPIGAGRNAPSSIP